MNKVLIYMEGGLIKSVHSNVQVEVCVLEEDKNEPSRFTTHGVQQYETAKFDQKVRDSWKRSVENHLKYEREVEVYKTQDIRPFHGTVDGNVKTDTDGSYYVTVLDQDNNAFDVDIFNIDLNVY